MKKYLILFLFSVAMLPVALFAQATPAAGTPAVSDAETITVFDTIVLPKEYSKEDVQTTTIDNFDMSEEWTVLMPREQGVALKKKITAKTKMDTTASTYCLGVKFTTYCRGFNWIEIKPPSPIFVPGTTKAIALSVAGRNLRHKLVAWVEDYQGVEYRIEMGSMNFKGWQRIAAPIPAHVKQYTRYVPEYRPLKLVKFVIEFDPDEMPGDYYIYVDNFEAAADMYEVAYDGDELIDKKSKVEKWEIESIDPAADKSNPGATGGTGK